MYMEDELMSISDVLREVQESRGSMLALLGELVETESPSGYVDGISRCMNIVIRAFDGVPVAIQQTEGDLAPTVRVELKPDELTSAEPKVLTICHVDTVYPKGTLERFPFHIDGDNVKGPGVFDMKAGLVQSIFAMRLLAQHRARLRRSVVLLCTPDEEIGSVSSRPQIEKEAAASCCVFIPEPSLGAEGALKTSRSGRAEYKISIRGLAAHSGLDPLTGASAIKEMAIQIGRIYEIARAHEGLHINVGKICGGTAVNVIADSAEATVDVRIARRDQLPHVEKAFAALTPVDSRTTLTVEGGLERPPWETDLDGGLLLGWARS